MPRQSNLQKLADQWVKNHKTYTDAWMEDEKLLLERKLSKEEYLRRDQIRQKRFTALQQRLLRDGAKYRPQAAKRLAKTAA